MMTKSPPRIDQAPVIGARSPLGQSVIFFVFIPHPVADL